MFETTQLEHAQQEFIGDVIEVLHQREADFLKKLQRKASTEPTNFRGRREPLEVAPNGSLSFGNPNGGVLATPGAPDFNHLLIPYVWLNTGLETSYDTIMNAGKNTVGDPLEQLTTSTGKTLVKWLNIFASNSNGTTRIGLVSARTSNSVLTLNDADDSIGATQIIAQPNMKGQRVTVWDPTGTTQRAGVVGAGAITVGAKTKTTITRDAGGIDWPSTVVAGDIVVPEGSTPSVGFKGIPYIVNDAGDYFGLSRTAIDVIRSVINAQGGAPLSAANLFSTWNRLRQRVGAVGLNGTGITEIACGMTQHEAYYKLVPTATFQHIGATLPKGDIGLSSHEFTWFGIPINQYLDWRGDRMDFLNFDYLKIANLKELGSMMGMPINEELQSFDGATNNYRAAKARFWDCGRDYFSPAAHRMACLSELDMTGLSQQKS